MHVVTDQGDRQVPFAELRLLEAAMSRPLGEEDWAALLVDGIQFFEHVIRY